MSCPKSKFQLSNQKFAISFSHKLFSGTVCFFLHNEFKGGLQTKFSRDVKIDPGIKAKKIGEERKSTDNVEKDLTVSKKKT